MIKKENLYNIIMYLYGGVFIIYLLNKPPKVFVKYLTVDNMSNVHNLNV
jgi:hypothetical protein